MRNLKKKVKNIGGKGKLTNNMIDRLQNYYGIAVRNNVDNLDGMQKAIRASLFHVASSKKEDYHSAYCPPGKDSWCAAQRDKALNTHNYRPGPGLPVPVIAHVKQIFNDLSKQELLEKCLHGKTQNQNESFHSTIWNRVPKTTHIGLETFEFGVYDAIATFNIGRIASLKIFEEMNINPGGFTVEGCHKINIERISKAEYHSSSAVKKHRKIKRGKHKSKIDKHEQTEGGVTYQAGGF